MADRKVFLAQLSFKATDKGCTSPLMMEVELAFEKGLGNWSCFVNGQFVGSIDTYSLLSDEELQKRSMDAIWRYVEGRFPSLELSVRSITSITPL